MKEYRSLSVVIPNYEGAELLPKFLPSVEKALANYKGEHEVIIVDDASKDNSWELLTAWESRSKTNIAIRNSENSGFSATCNKGLYASKYEILFFLNNDVELEEDFFSYFNSYFDSDNTFALAVAGFNYYDRLQIDGVKSIKLNRGMTRATKNIFPEADVQDKWYETFAVQGSYFFAERQKTLNLNGFDELMSPYLYEETDLCYRALKRGWKIYYEPKAKAYHAVSSSLSKIDAPFRKKVIAQRNRLIFIWKNIHDRKLLLYHNFWLVVKMMKNKVSREAYKEARALGQKIIRLRMIEKQDAVVSDRELLKRYEKPPVVDIPIKP